MPAPLFANEARRARSAPTKRASAELPLSLERSYTVNTAARGANNIVVNVNRHSRNLIDNFLKGLASSPRLPRSLIDDFLNGLAQGSKLNRKRPRKSAVSNLSNPEAPVPNNIPRWLQEIDDLRAEHERAHFHSPSKMSLPPTKPTNCQYRPVLSLDTNVGASTPKNFLKPEQAERTSQPRGQRPCLSLDTNVSAYNSNNSLEREAGEHVKAFYLGLINGDIDPAAYMAVDLPSLVSSLGETPPPEEPIKTLDRESTFSAISKTSLELEAFFEGLINGDSDSETSSKCAFLGTRVSPSTGSPTFARSAVPSPLASKIALPIQALNLVDSEHSSEKSEELIKPAVPHNHQKGNMGDLLATSLLAGSDDSSSDDEDLQSLHSLDRTQPTEDTGESLPMRRLPVSEPASNIMSKVRVQEWLDEAQPARQYWDQKKALRRLERRNAQRQSLMQVSPFFHAAL